MQTTTRGPYTELSLASRGLKNKKVQIYSLGVGRDVDRQELQDIASSKDKVFYADSFEDLISMVQTIVQKMCPGRSSSQTHGIRVLLNPKYAKSSFLLCVHFDVLWLYLYVILSQDFH